MRITENLLLSHGYIQFEHPIRHDHNSKFYQLVIKDDHGESIYSIEANHYLIGSSYEGWEFSCILYTDDSPIHISTVQWFNESSSNNTRTLEDVHNLFNKMYRVLTYEGENK